MTYIDSDEVQKVLHTTAVLNTKFAIKPGDADFPVEQTRRLDENTSVISLFPHMHLRGKSFRYILHRRGQEPKVLLDVPRYDFNWQNAYVLSQPLNLKKGDKLQAIAHFDNSSDNPYNPNPSRTVEWGDQSWEEMMIGFYDIGVSKKRARELVKASTAELEEARRKGKELRGDNH